MREERGRPSGYSTRRLASHFWRLVLTSGTRPLRLVALFGALLSLGALAVLGWVLWAKCTDQVPVQGWTSVMVILLVTAGAILFSLGVVAEYLGIAAKSAMGKPLYLVVSDPADGPLGRERRAAAARRSAPATRRAGRARGPVSARAAHLGRRARRPPRRQVDGSLDARTPRRSAQGPIDWGDEARRGRRARARGRTRSSIARARSGAPWRLMWCAGAGVVVDAARGARAGDARWSRRFLDALADRLSDEPALARRGHASSSPPRRAASTPASPARHAVRRAVAAWRLAPYGHEKLAQEELFDLRRDAVRRRPADRPVLEPLRPGPEPVEAAGPHLARWPRRAAARADLDLRPPRHHPRLPLRRRRRPHGGRRGGAAGDGSAERGDGRTRVTKIFASEVETTVASVLGAWRQVAPPAAAGRAGERSGRDALQPRTSSFRSRVWPELRGVPDPAPARRRRRSPGPARPPAGRGLG